MSYPYSVKALDRVLGNGIRLVLGVLFVLLVPSVQGGQKIRFSNPPTEVAPGLVDLKNNQSLAPENMVGFKRGGEVATDVLPSQSGNEERNPAADKKRQKLLEDRNNWLGVGTDGKKIAPGEEGDAKGDGNSSEKDDAREAGRTDTAKNDQLRLSAKELSRVLNSSPGDIKGNQERDREKKELEKKTAGNQESGNLSGRISPAQNSLGLGPSEIRGGISSQRMGTQFEEREAMRKADVDRFQSLLTPMPMGRPPGAGFNEGGALSGAVNQRGPAGFAVPGGFSGGGSQPGAPGSLGSRALNDGSGFGPAQFGPLGPGQGMTPGINKPEETLRQQPKPAVLQIPKRNQ